MIDIPEQLTIPVSNIERSALQSLMKNAASGFAFEELLQLVLLKGLSSLVKDRELPGISEEIHEKAEASVPTDNSASKGRRVAADYVGFSIDPHQQAALEKVEERFPLADEDELLRILLDVALRALPHDDLARTRLETASLANQLSEGSAS